jgi:hypothetical protein
MRHLITVVVFIASLVTASAAMSTTSITEYEKIKTNKKKWPATQIYLSGVGVGASVMSAALAAQSKSSLFCQPQEIVLNQNSYIKLIDAFIAKNDIPEETPVETVLIMAMAVAFPCK